MTKLKNKAFVLLAAIGILSILAIIVFGVALNVDFTYRYARHRGGQRELAQNLRAAAAMIAKDTVLLTRLSQSSTTEELFKLEGKATILAKGVQASPKLAAVLPGASCVLLEAVPARQSALGRQAIYAFQPGREPILVAETTRLAGGGKK